MKIDELGGEYVGTLTWEPLKSEFGPHGICRTKVIGGWLVAFAQPSPTAGGLTFIPDINHQWLSDEAAD